MTGKRRKKVQEEDPKSSSSSSSSKSRPRLQLIKELPSRYHIYFVPPRDEEEADYCTIEVEGVEIYVQKDIIAEKSTVLGSMLKNNWKEAQTGHIKLPGKTLENFIRFIDCLHQSREAVRTLQFKAPSAVELMNLAWLANEYDATEAAEIAKNELGMKLHLSSNLRDIDFFDTKHRIPAYKLALQCLKMEEDIGSSTSNLYKMAIMTLTRTNYHTFCATTEYNDLELKTKFDITTAKCRQEKKS